MAASWKERYDALAARLDGIVDGAGPILLGFSAFADAIVAAADTAPLHAATAPQAARRLGAEIVSRVASGVGGEVMLDWPDGDDWLAANLPHRIQAGGTSLQIANALAVLGCGPILALADRTPEQMRLLMPGVRLLPLDGAAPPAAKARHWIFEAGAGTRVMGVDVRRATRTIVRLAGDGPERDPAFAALDATIAGPGTVAAISSLVSTPDAMVDEALAYVAGVASHWRRLGVAFVHLELADYGNRAWLRERLLSALNGKVTSIGMSLSEWQGLASGDELIPGLQAFASRHGLSRVCVHADDWAVSVTRDAPEREREALMAGCLLASARAHAGAPVRPEGAPPGARFADPQWNADLGGGWHSVSCPSPHTTDPRSTVGLGDTFVAGCLLIHASGGPAAQTPDTGEIS